MGSSVCASPDCGGSGGAEQLAAFDSGVLSSENMGQRYEISIRVSGAQPAIWLKSGAISSGSMDQNSDWTLLCLRIVKHTFQRRFY